MSHRNNYAQQRGRNYSDPTPSRFNSKYQRRGGRNNNRPEPNRAIKMNDDVDTLMVSIGRHLTTDGNPSRDTFSTQHNVNQGKGSRFQKRKQNSNVPQIGWWRITILESGDIGKDRVMAAVQGRCARPFLPYHYHIEARTKAGVFFVNNQNDADMIKRLNGKIEVQGLDILRIQMCRIPAPVPSIDEDLRGHLKDHLINHRFDQQTFQLNLSNIADDEELSSLGIFPQFNKQAFIRDVVEILNKHLYMTRILDLGSNNIVNLYEFRNLHLNDLYQISFASNQLKNVDDFDHLKQLPNLAHLNIKNNPLLTSTNNKLKTTSIDDIISAIRQKVPQLKRINDADLPPKYGFGTDLITVTLPNSNPHCVPQDMESFLAKFIEEYYRLFDTRGRGELHACYHDSCMLSVCISTADNSIVSTRNYKFGQLIYESRNLHKVIDDNRRMNLLRHGKTAVIDFLRVKFPLTKHDGNSFRVDVLSTANNRAIFTVNGLFKEVDQGSNAPIRCFQRTFTCAQTPAGVLIIADHILITNATEIQAQNLNRSLAAAATTTSTAPTTNSQNIPNNEADVQNQMIHKFSQESGMNANFSRLCLQENNWNYQKAAEVFVDLKKKNQIPAEAFVKS